MCRIKTDYINRELSWIKFNERVLEEAEKNSNPIMERLKFLSITSSNEDEFFMVRVAGIEQQSRCNIDKKDVSGYTPDELMNEISYQIKSFSRRQEKCFVNIMNKLNDKKYSICKIDDLNKNQKRYINNFYETEIHPVLTPIALDSMRRFPHIEGRFLYVIVRIFENNENRFAVVKIPKNVPRIVEVPSNKKHKFVMLEDIIIYKLCRLFEIHKIRNCGIFRITRNADIEIDDDADDLLSEVKKTIKKRKKGRVIRIEHDDIIDEISRKFLCQCFKVKKGNVYEKKIIDYTFLLRLIRMCNDKSMFFDDDLKTKIAYDFTASKDIFEAIKERDRLVYHPYDSFDYVIDFLNQAAEDKNVLSIKQSLYRVSNNSPVIETLIKAAKNGKPVTVLVELKARFDEDKNVAWAEKLETAGCNVIYGIPGLKTHCKILSVVRCEDDTVRTYVHMSTGNYNDMTAKGYTDIGFFTCKKEFGDDAAVLFNMLTGYIVRPAYKKIVVAPYELRSFLEERIEKEIEYSKRGLPCGIFMKVNSLTDTEIISYLYKASQCGVPIRLLVRGVCCLIPGRKNLSDKIIVYSIVGRFLEHSRIFRFENGGDEEIWVGSADIMPRNLNRRVELVFPIEDIRLKNRIDDFISIMASDNTNKRILNSDGDYIICKRKENEVKINSQMLLLEYAKNDNIREGIIL